MDILMVTSELSPYARTTRTADAVAALAKSLCQLEHRVTVAVPRHAGFEAGGLLVARRLTPLDVGDGEPVTVFDGQLSTGATLVLFDVGAGGPAAFCRAAAALARQRAERGEPFDVVHLHDAESAPTAALLAGTGVSTVLTIHDGEALNVVPPGVAQSFGVEIPALAREAGGVSLLALGARFADAVTAVSPALAADLRVPGRYGALGNVLRDRETDVVGILSGLDYAVANPATDSAIKARFDAEDVASKGSAKTDLLRTRGLDIESARPLVAAIATGDEDAELMREAAPVILRNDLSLIVFVPADSPAHAGLEAVSTDFSDRMEVDAGYDESMVRRACAGADFMLLPRAYDSSGVLSRLAQRYGAPPIGRSSGAHVDAIVDCDGPLETGTGFLFDDATVDSLAGAVARALSAYTSQRFPALVRRVMRLDLSWDRPARRYAQVYKQVLAQRDKSASR